MSDKKKSNGDGRNVVVHDATKNELFFALEALFNGAIMKIQPSTKWKDIPEETAAAIKAALVSTGRDIPFDLVELRSGTVATAWPGYGPIQLITASYGPRKSFIEESPNFRVGIMAIGSEVVVFWEV